MTALLDSWVWIEYFRDGPRAKDAAGYIEGNTDICISSVTVAEVFRFLLHSETKALAEKLTSWMMRRAHLLPVSAEIAWSAAELKHQHKWGLGDALIYATTLMQKATLVTGDSDFKEVQGIVYLGK